MELNGSLKFELAQFRLGPGTVPISIVLYIDATFIKHGIPIRPIYSELLLSFDIICNINYDIVRFEMISHSCLHFFVISPFDQWLA